jgi:hypothetical protein
MHHAIGIFIWIRIEQNSVDHAKDGGCGANPQGERQDRGEDETGSLAELAKGEA